MSWRRASLSAATGKELSLSGPAIAALLESVFDKGAAFRFQAKGYSMHPFIRNGDVLTLSAIGRKRPGIGDVVAAVHPANDRLLVHRVIGIRNGHCLLKGDNMASVDGLFPFHKLLGRVVAIHRNGRRIRLGLGVEKRVLAWVSKLRMVSGER